VNREVHSILNDSKAPAVTTGELGRLLRKPWRSLSSNVLMPAFLSVLAGMGWQYVPGKGRREGRFERMEAEEALAA